MVGNVILTLDLGTKTGWQLHPQGVGGTNDFKPGRYEGGGMRFLRFVRWLDGLHLGGEIKEVYFEEVRRHMGTDAAHVYGGFLAQLTSWCENNSIPYQGVPVGTIKKHITGKGNASKAKVIEAVKALGHLPEDDNHADAIALMDYILSHNEVK